MTARQILRPRKRHESRLPLLVQRADGFAHGRSEGPFGIEGQSANSGSCIGLWNRYVGTNFVVEAARVRNQQVRRVVAAAQKDEQESWSPRGSREERSSPRGPRESACQGQHLSAVEACLVTHS